MADKNFLNRMVSRVNALPDQLHPRFLSLLVGRAIKFAGTAKVRVEKLNDYEAVVVLRNHRKVQNHIGSIHAAAMALVGETATGLLVGMSVSDDAIPVLKTMHIDYTKRCQGDLRAHARLGHEQVMQIRTQDKGEISVPVSVTDAAGVTPIDCQFIWAWTPKPKPKKQMSAS